MRATSIWTAFWLEQWFDVAPLAYRLVSLVLHVACTWLVFGIGLAWVRMRQAAFWAAAFFAVAEGHQEAVMWFTAINELWMFFFGAAALLCWLAAESRERGGLLRWAGAALFGLALLSKESAVIWLPLFVLSAPDKNPRRLAARLAPYLVLAAVAVLSILDSRSFRFTDGSFSLAAPFWITWPRGIARILWFWGWLAAGAVSLAGDRQARRSAFQALAWLGIALLPYSFLTYSTQVPSRQTYLASAGLAFLFGLAIAGLRRRPVAAAVVAVMLIHNVGYLWTKKQAQFLARAEPTEQLIRLARRTGGTIWVRCFPRTPWIAEEAVHLGAGRPPSMLVWSESQALARQSAAVFCYQER